jgi:hypothetical protein
MPFAGRVALFGFKLQFRVGIIEANGLFVRSQKSSGGILGTKRAFGIECARLRSLSAKLHHRSGSRTQVHAKIGVHGKQSGRIRSNSRGLESWVLRNPVLGLECFL